MRTVDGRFTTERAEQLLCRQAVDHLRCVEHADRRRAKLHVGDRLGDDPTDADHDVGAELWIPNHAGNQFAMPPDHRRDQQRHVAISGCCFRKKVRGCSVNRGSVAQPQTNQATFCLVGNARAAEFHDNRVAEHVGRVDGLRRSHHLALVGHGHAIGAQQHL